MIDPSVFAMIGAVAMLSGFARMTVSLVVIMLELTGELNYAVPFMCSVLVAKLVGDSFTLSIYDAHSLLAGYAIIEEPKGLRLSPHLSDIAEPCSEAMLLSASASLTLGELCSHLGVEERVESIDKADDSLSFTPVFGGSVPSPSHIGNLLVVTKAGDPAEILGVIDTFRIRRWLRLQHAASPDMVCSFIGSSTSDELDASSLVERHFVRFLSTAPVLTVVCAFREDPLLQYCICRDEEDRFNIGVLSRIQLDRAFLEKQFAAAFQDRRNPLVPRGCLAALLDCIRGDSVNYSHAHASVSRPVELPRL